MKDKRKPQIRKMYIYLNWILFEKQMRRLRLHRMRY